MACSMLSVILSVLLGSADACGTSQRVEGTSWQNNRVELKLIDTTLATAASALAEAAGVGIIIDDEPMKRTASFQLQGPAIDVLAKIAEAYDYAWSVNKRGIVILRKQFHSDIEHPQIG